jgi:hypothetical protein
MWWLLRTWWWFLLTTVTVWLVTRPSADTIEFVSEAFDRELLYLGAPLDGIAVAVSRRTVEG